MLEKNVFAVYSVTESLEKSKKYQYVILVLDVWVLIVENVVLKYSDYTPNSVLDTCKTAAWAKSTMG